MATLSFQGLDQIAHEMSRMGRLADSVADQMLEAGAAQVAAGWQQAIDEAGLVETGAMRASVGPAKGGVKASGPGKYIEIYPQGKDSHGVRNADKAFINHYGNSTHKGHGFVDRAEEYGEALAVPVMTKIWEDAK